MSKKLTLNDAETAATVSEAGNMDFLTTALDSSTAVTGTQKYLQLAAAAGAGAVMSNRRHTGDFFNFG